MTIECRESIFWGHKEKTNVIEPGRFVTVDKMRMRNHPRGHIGTKLTVITPDEVVITYDGLTTSLSRKLFKDEINKAHIESIPTGLIDLFLGRRKFFSWRP